MDEEYSDGIDTNGYLKYEKTQNRDITDTVERFNRSLKFRDSSKDIIELLSPIMKRDSERFLTDIWRNKHDSHVDPKALSVSVDIVPPVLKKVHPEGDTDKYFRMHKEYPFYYLMNLKIVAKFLPFDDDAMKDDEAWYGKWFIDNIVPSLSKKMLEKSKEALATKFNNVFAFPYLEALERTKDASDTIKDSMDYVTNRINVILSPVLKFNKNNDEEGTTSRFDSSEEMYEILNSRTALALERIIHV